MQRSGCPAVGHDHPRLPHVQRGVHNSVARMIHVNMPLGGKANFRNSAMRVTDGTTSSSVDASVASTIESSVDEAGKASAAELLRSLNIQEVKPEHLFDSSHVEHWSPLLMAYFPFGCLLAAIRFAAWVAGIAADAPWFRNMSVINAYMALLGVKVTWHNTNNIPQDQRHVLVSNHISVGDLLVLFQQPQRYVHLITSALPEPVYATQHLPAILQPANKETYLAIAAAQQLNQAEDAALQQQQQHCNHHQQPQQESVQLHHQLSTSSNSSSGASSRRRKDGSAHGNDAAAAALAAAASCRAAVTAVQDAPVHVFPEGGMTNGNGMMRFSRGFMLFADKMPVVPVALRLKTAFPEVKCHTLTSPFLANLFWFSFQPWTEIEAVALPPMQLQPGESKAAFVQRVQLAIAQELGVWITDMNIQQKRAAMQKQQRRQQKLKTRR